MSEENFDVYDDEGKTIDYLEEDTEIPTQRYGIVSFISPEKVIKQKNAFLNEKFIQWLDYDWKVKGMEKFMDFISKKYSLKIDDLLNLANVIEANKSDTTAAPSTPWGLYIFIGVLVIGISGLIFVWLKKLFGRKKFGQKRFLTELVFFALHFLIKFNFASTWSVPCTFFLNF